MITSQGLTETVRPSGRPHLLQVSADDPVAWAADQRHRIRALVTEHGAVLVRGLGLADSRSAAAVIRRLSPELITETEGFAARHCYDHNLYSSASWPAGKPMCMHHELSYRAAVPGLLLFACLQAPDSDGSTGVADAAAVLESLPVDLVRRFETAGWQLRRTFTEEVGTSLQQAFGGADRLTVESYCRSNGIEYAWGDDGSLRTRQRRPAVIRHPVTGRRSWVNQIAFLSEWTLEPEVREFLVDMYGPDGLPFGTSFGDGAPVTASMVDEIAAAYQQHTRREPWQSGDLMLVDNLATAHDREPYTGRRELMVALAEPARLSAGTDRTGR